jgi:hypothetical protein
MNPLINIFSPVTSGATNTFTLSRYLTYDKEPESRCRPQSGF